MLKAVKENRASNNKNSIHIIKYFFTSLPPENINPVGVKFRRSYAFGCFLVKLFKILSI